MTENQMPIPTVIQAEGRLQVAYDIFSRLLKDRVVFAGGVISEAMANVVVAQLLFLSNEDPHADVSMYVNSRGGGVTAGLAIYDTMQFIRCDVATYCVGTATSMGAVLLASGTPGKRYALPNSTIMIHQPWQGYHEEYQRITELEIEARQILRVRDQLYKILSEHTGRTLEQVQADCEWDNWLSAEEALEYGCIDKILQRMPEPADKAPKDKK